MKSSIWVLVALVAAGTMARAGAQTPDSGSPPTVTNSIVSPGEAVPAPCCRIAAGTVIELEITETISSARHKRGDKFSLRLQTPLIVDGTTVVPAGAVGVGEIVHAAPSRGGGKPGELLLAARYLQHDAVQLPLRGLKLGATGKDTSRVAIGVAAAIGPFAHFIHGREIEIPSGTVVNAKLAQDVSSPATASSIPPSNPPQKE